MPIAARQDAGPADEARTRRFLDRYMPAGAGGSEGDEDLPLHDDARRGLRHRPLPGDPRIVVASACSGHGYKFASVIGEILADLATGGQTPHDIGRFAIARFVEHGSASRSSRACCFDPPCKPPIDSIRSGLASGGAGRGWRLPVGGGSALRVDRKTGACRDVALRARRSGVGRSVPLAGGAQWRKGAGLGRRAECAHGGRVALRSAL